MLMRTVKIKVMQMLSFLPDDMVVRIQYRIKTGRFLNLKNPQRYTEKLQWYKLYYKNPIMKQCVDKFEVRNYVMEKGCSEILNECYGVYSSIDNINVSDFPNKVIFKDTLGGGSNSVEIFDKRKDDYHLLKKKLVRWLKEPDKKKHPGREWPYDNQKHRIIVEQVLEQANGDLADYKFYCFDGVVKCFYVRTDYNKNHSEGKMAFFYRNLKLIEGVYMDYCNPSSEVPQLPIEIRKMIDYAELLSSGFPHVRVDLYNVDGKIIFGELTFYNASGYMSFIPDEYDFVMGDYFVLPKVNGGA